MHPLPLAQCSHSICFQAVAQPERERERERGRERERERETRLLQCCRHFWRTSGVWYMVSEQASWLSLPIQNFHPLGWLRALTTGEVELPFDRSNWPNVLGDPPERQCAMSPGTPRTRPFWSSLHVPLTRGLRVEGVEMILSGLCLGVAAWMQAAPLCNGTSRGCSIWVPPKL